MHSNYEDITKRIPESPLWYDCNGVPRYDPFHPDLSPNIYADQCVLLLIECQSCGRRFSVEMNTGPWPSDERPPSKWHYGDPPTHECAGDTMNCEDVEVLEAWHRPHMRWRRLRRLEGPIQEAKP